MSARRGGNTPRRGGNTTPSWLDLPPARQPPLREKLGDRVRPRRQTRTPPPPRPVRRPQSGPVHGPPGGFSRVRNLQNLEANRAILAGLGIVDPVHGSPAGGFSPDAGYATPAEYYVGGGGAADGAAVDALLSELGAARGAAITDLDAIRAQLAQRLGGLRAEQERVNAATGQTITQDAAGRLAAYQQALAPLTADLQNQGFSASPLQQQATLDTQRLQDYGARQGDLSARFAEIQNRSFADRAAITSLMDAAARQKLELAYSAMVADAAAGGRGGGGGGRGGRGWGGGGGDDAVMTAGDAALLADASLDPEPIKQQFLAGLPGAQRPWVRNTLRRALRDDLSNLPHALQALRQRAVNRDTRRSAEKGREVGSARRTFRNVKREAPKRATPLINVHARQRRARDRADIALTGRGY